MLLGYKSTHFSISFSKAIGVLRFLETPLCSATIVKDCIFTYNDEPRIDFGERKRVTMNQTQRFVAVVELAQVLGEVKVRARKLADQCPEYEALADAIAYADDLADMALDVEISSDEAQEPF